MTKETQNKLITLPIKVSHNTYKRLYTAYIGCIALIGLIHAIVLIAGLCWFLMN